MANKLDYTLIGPKLRPGDLVIFRSNTFGGALIRLAGQTPWSHIAIVFRAQQGNVDALLLESSTNGASLRDEKDGLVHKGVEVLKVREKAFCGSYTRVAFRRLHTPFTEAQVAKLEAFYEEVSGRVFEEGKLELLRAQWDGAFGANKQDLEQLFCSELVAEALRRCRVIGEGGQPSNEFVPKEFAEGTLSDLYGEMEELDMEFTTSPSMRLSWWFYGGVTLMFTAAVCGCALVFIGD